MKKIASYIFILFGTLLCISFCSNDPTRVAIQNSGSVAITSVTVSSADGSINVTFTSIAAGATSAFQDVSGDGSATVSCATTAECTSGAVSVTSEKDNTINVSDSAAPGSTSSGGGGGWL